MCDPKYFETHLYQVISMRVVAHDYISYVTRTFTAQLCDHTCELLVNKTDPRFGRFHRSNIVYKYLMASNVVYPCRGLNQSVCELSLINHQFFHMRQKHTNAWYNHKLCKTF